MPSLGLATCSTWTGALPTKIQSTSRFCSSVTNVLAPASAEASFPAACPRIPPASTTLCFAPTTCSTFSTPATPSATTTTGGRVVELTRMTAGVGLLLAAPLTGCQTAFCTTMLLEPMTSLAFLTTSTIAPTAPAASGKIARPCASFRARRGSAGVTSLTAQATAFARPELAPTWCLLYDISLESF
ncbi:hypothetical protein HDK64DRAFT_282304 [Phyllosticta capitalensis]